MTHLLKTPPVTEPVSLADMREHLGITQADDISRDNIIAGRIISAREWAEQYTGQAFITQAWTCYAHDFPYNVDTGHRLRLKQPLVSVTAVKYNDADGIQQILAPSGYQVDLVGGCIVPAYGSSWPLARAQLNSVQVEYVCGYGNPADVPESIKDAIRFIVGQWEVFQTSMEGVVRPFTIPNAAKQLLDNYIDMRDWF
jgi:phage conserved hypothetical protein, phiE125 gp8 family